MIYAKLNPDKTEVVEYIETESIPPHKAGYLLPYIKSEKPAYNNISQFVVEGFPNIQSDAVYQTWIIKEKTPEEIANDQRVVCTPLELWNFVGQTKQTQIFVASESDPAVKMFLYMLGMATQIESDHPLTIQAFQYLTEIGIFLPGEVDEIFASLKK